MSPPGIRTCAVLTGGRHTNKSATAAERSVYSYSEVIPSLRLVSVNDPGLLLEEAHGDVDEPDGRGGGGLRLRVGAPALSPAALAVGPQRSTTSRNSGTAREMGTVNAIEL
jgi:hypothetical protein